MPAANEVARLKRDIALLVEAVNLDLRASGKPPSATQKRALKSEIESCMQTLDELRTRLS